MGSFSLLLFVRLSSSAGGKRREVACSKLASGRPVSSSVWRPLSATFSTVLADDFLPVYDVSDEVATVDDAEPQLVSGSAHGC
jgi:hypothetical protein